MVSLLAAVDPHGVLARRDGPHYRSPQEIDRIGRLTHRRAVILGRKTFGALSMVPPDRWFLVLTRDEDLLAEGGVRYLSGYGYWFLPSFAEALHAARTLSHRASAPELFVAGGPEPFAEALPLAQRLYRMRVEAPQVTPAVALPQPSTPGWRLLHTEIGSAGHKFEIVGRP
jgi:dihydrofolate reductase